MGLAYEASKMLIEYGFYTLNLNKITSDIFPDNEGIIRVLAKLGFTEEGRLKDHYFHQGQFKDVVIYSLLRKDYKK